MILTLTPSPAIDLTWHVKELLPGETLRTGRGAHRAGGKGINVSRVLTSMGYTTEAVAPVGGETGERFSRELEASGVAHSLLAVRSETRQTVTIVDASTGHSTVISEEAPALTAEEWRDLLALVDSRLDHASVLVISGQISKSAPVDLLGRLVRSAKAGGVATVIDTSGPAMLDAARAGATLLKPNRVELDETTGEGTVAHGIEVLLRLGAESVCVSLGEDGLAAAIQSAPTLLHRAALKRPIRGNATGAGDAAVAALAVGLDEGQPLDQMLRAATVWSASAVSMRLAGELNTARFGTLRADVVSATGVGQV